MTRKQLREARLDAGLSVAKAAVMVHVGARTWVRWESGETPIPATAAHLFCLLIGMNYKAKK